MPPSLLDALFPHLRAAWLLHLDDDLVAIDKPPFLATHAQEAGRTDDARSRLGAHLTEATGEKEPYLGVHQRLDKGTSGVLVFARRKSANPSLAKQFEGREVHKTYLAAVSHAKALADRGVLRHRVAPGEDGAMRVVDRGPVRGSQDAVTGYEIVRRVGDRALVKLTPETGRTHQIRVQLAHVGAPVAGDRMYGGEGCVRLMLHAAALGLAHPGTGEKITLRAPVPAAFDAWLDHAAGGLGDVDAIEAAMRAAADARYGVGRSGDTTAARLVNGAGDGLPGLALDLYGEHLVLSAAEEIGEEARERALDAAARLGARGVYLKVRPKHASVIVDTRRDAFAPKHAVRGEDAEAAFTVLEGGVPLRVRLGDGLSTGVFLDQRENRARVRALSAGARVANLFAYTGAFSVAAAVGGARATSTVDVSKGVLAWARENLDGVGADAKAHVVVEADATSWLAREGKKGARFELVILDPPSFATTKQGRFSAASDYRALAVAAFAIVAPGGKVLACTNHRGIVRAKLRRYLHEAAREAKREVGQMKDLPDPVDFPPDPGAEAHLKSILVTLR